MSPDVGIIYSRLPTSRRDALTVHALSKVLHIATAQVTGALRGLHMSRMVDREMRHGSNVVKRSRQGVSSFVRLKKMHYWRIGDPL